jgi:hypothetical protein
MKRFSIKEEVMSLLRFCPPIIVGILAVALLSLVGCPRSTEKPKAATPTSSAVRYASANEPVEPSKLPAAEFQQPAALPPSEPLAKPVQEAAEPPPAAAPKKAPVPTDANQRGRADFETPESENPLRDSSARPAETLATKKNKDETPATKKSTAAAPSAASQPPAGRPRTAKNSGVPFDPIMENGSIFKGWPKPKLALVITGTEEGYLEPCGCAGLDRMKGGMSRRTTLFRQLRKDGWPVVGLDVGGLVRGFGRQAELKFQTAVEAKRKAGYDAIAFGTDDLRLPAGELVAVAASVDGKPSPFVSANVGLLGKPGEITPQYRVIEAGGHKIGVTAVLGKKYQQELHNDEVEFSDPVAALKKIVPELKQKADYLVLLAHATREESIELAKTFPAFNIVVCSDGLPEPPLGPQAVAGTTTLFVTVGYKGMNAVVIGLFDNPAEPFRYQRVPLDSRFASSPDMKALMTAYQEQLKAIGFAGLGLRPAPNPLLESNGKFIGALKCQPCHEKSYDIWKKSGHGHAYSTLAKLDPPRNFDPECVSCHVTGWNPGMFFPYASGYESQAKTPHLINTGCEDCHGPGEKHAAAEISGSEALREKLRKAMVITKAESKKKQCYTCHDLDNSPDFNFDLYWPFVEHHEKE